MGYNVFSPISHSHPISLYMDNSLDSEFWTSVDEHWQKKCDKLILLTLPGWKESVGLKKEYLIAIEIGQPILFMDPMTYETTVDYNCDAKIECTNTDSVQEVTQTLVSLLNELPIDEKIERINNIKILLHENSPFNKEPVDCVKWVKADKVIANDYNPNIVAPPELELLKVSIEQDGYTQPIVSWKNKDTNEVVDGFHRHRVGQEYKVVKERIHGYLPIVSVNEKSTERGNRIASTIRHNRARGKHTIEGMSDIVVELKNRNWKNARIAKELGMEEDEILRLCQITGLSDLFKDEEFSKSWDIEDSDDNFVPLEDDIDAYGEEVKDFRTVNTNDEGRIFHTHDLWECEKAGFYKTTMDGMTKKECEEAYAEFLSDSERFSDALAKLIKEWKHSCEHYLTNNSMNRIAWLGQAAMCYATKIPSTFRSGFNLLTKEQQNIANNVALKYLNIWLKKNGRHELSLEEALSNKQMELY